MSGDAGDRVVVVSPHLDDAVLSAWRVLAGRRGVEVLTCFAGYPPQDAAMGSWEVATGGLQGRAAVAARRHEDRAALALSDSGVTHLDLPDAQYRRDDTGVVDNLAELLGPRLRGREEVWLPAGIGGHVDHCATRDAVLAASDASSRRMLYADLPYAAQPGWPAGLTGGVRDRLVAAAAPRLGMATPIQQWRTALATVPVVALDDVRLTLLTAAERRDKWAAVQCYGSQLEALRCGRRHHLRRRRVFAFEAYWSLG